MSFLSAFIYMDGVAHDPSRLIDIIVHRKGLYRVSVKL